MISGIGSCNPTAQRGETTSAPRRAAIAAAAALGQASPAPSERRMMEQSGAQAATGEDER